MCSEINISEPREIVQRVKAALDIADTNEMRTHLEWEARQMVTHVPPERMTTCELAALVAVLHAAHTRVLTPPGGGGPTLRIVTGEDLAEVSQTAG